MTAPPFRWIYDFFEIVRKNNVLKASPLRITIIFALRGRRTSKLSFAEFRIHIPLRYATLHCYTFKLSEAEFSEYHQPIAAASAI